MSSGLHGRYIRWLYRGGRPNRLCRVLNRIQVAVHDTGLIMPERLVTLEVPGRVSGKLIRLPLVVADYGGERYLVAMLGGGANWVANVRAAGDRAVLRHGRRERVRLEAVPPAARGPVVRRYLQVAPGARPHVPLALDSPAADYDRVAADLPVFRIRPDA
ncbi:nitroreductase/quinone reductase family protein [Nonomuraea soli]|uniref:Nitroreductase family deazaflavin-dependent oxidoreductase n=1 Tax=Nonomuraea soli TaxID=1032476 RepID=A0A7W0HNS7_9ACTN|nr:nitroreductase/quinone reductase family protein [Nonomuraea soli]MBA2890047.1 hypothetical protein [Nonomuraea soli]